MRATSLLRAVLGWEHTRVTGFEIRSSDLVIDVAPRTRRARCGGCGRKVHRVHDRRERMWRHLSLAGTEVSLRYQIRRVDCRECGVTTELVPWADHAVGFTREFEDVVGFLAQRMDKTSITDLLRIGWETVGRIIGRVVARHGHADRLEGLTHIGIDELSYRRHHEYVTIVSDLIRGRVVWVAPGRNAETARRFFAELGAERTARLEVIAIDMGEAYKAAVSECAPAAQLVFDRFHVQRLAHDALDEVRRQEVRAARERSGAEAKELKNTRFALQKNPWNLEQRESERLSALQHNNRRIYRGYLLKEGLAGVLDGRQVHVARRRLDEWCDWAARSRLTPFQRVAATVRKHLEGILAYVKTRHTNAVAEGLNGKIRTITRRSFGFHSVTSLIAMIFLCCSGIAIALSRTSPLRASASTKR